MKKLTTHDFEKLASGDVIRANERYYRLIRRAREGDCGSGPGGMWQRPATWLCAFQEMWRRDRKSRGTCLLTMQKGMRLYTAAEVCFEAIERA